jgi:glycosyltransferase involved in cell wall biosynthesis
MAAFASVSTMPKVSIITTLYNRSRFLRPRVESILQQSFRDFEWIVIDDHSTDDTFERFERLTRSDRRVLALRNAANIGQGPTTRKAFELARGDYVYVTDDDDLCQPTFLERMAGLLDARPNVGLAYCRHRYIDGKGGTWDGLPPLRQSSLRAGASEFRALLRSCHIPSPCSIIRRAAAERAGVFRTFVPPSCVDDHLCLKTCLVADVAFVAEPLATRRIHVAQATRVNLASPDFVARQELDSFDLVEDLFAHLPDDRKALAGLRSEGLWYAAERLRPFFRLMRRSGAVDTARALEAVVRRRVQHYPVARLDPGPIGALGPALRETVSRVVRRATYTPPAPGIAGDVERAAARDGLRSAARRPLPDGVAPVGSVSVIVCVRDQPQALDACLGRLTRLHAPEGTALEIVVVDNGSDETMAALVGRHGGPSPIPVRYLREPLPGLSRARNRGVCATSSDVIAFVDADCLAARDWVVRICEEFEADPELSILGGRIELYNRRDRRLTIKGTRHYQLMTAVGQLEGFLHGCNHALRREVIGRIGLYDVRLGKGAPIPAAGDTDFAYRAYRAGLKLVYSPHCVVHHNHGRRTDAVIDDLWRSYRLGSGALRMKHIWARDRAMATWALRDYAHQLVAALGAGLRSPKAGRRRLRELAHHAQGARLFLRHRMQPGDPAPAAGSPGSQGPAPLAAPAARGAVDWAAAARAGHPGE